MKYFNHSFNGAFRLTIILTVNYLTVMIHCIDCKTSNQLNKVVENREKVWFELFKTVKTFPDSGWIKSANGESI